MVKSLFFVVSTGSSSDRRTAKAEDSVCVLSRFILLPSWIEFLGNGADMDSDSSKPKVSQSVRMGTA